MLLLLYSVIRYIKKARQTLMALTMLLMNYTTTKNTHLVMDYC